jgi:cell wall-associated NlpC family hydrolase
MTTEQQSRQAIVAEARSWRGTPYKVCADVKHAGVDCGMLIVRVFVDLELVPAFDPRPYSPSWMLHRDEEEYLKHVFPRGHRITKDEVAAGDIVLFRAGRTYSHGGIVTIANPLTIVHAFARVGRVVEDQVDRITMLAARLPTALYASCWSPSR